MFDEIDKTIFPNRCEVLEIVPHSHYVYPIFKNGSSSLKKLLPMTNWKIINEENIKHIKFPITVYLRNAKDRFISGVNTYLQHLRRDYPTLDQSTIIWFVENYLFLNRHFCPQFFWILNLSRYVDLDIELRLAGMESLKDITPLNSRSLITPITPELLSIIDNFNWKKLETYMFLDQILTDRIGEELTIRELFSLTKNQYPDLYQLIFGKSLEIFRVLSEA